MISNQVLQDRTQAGEFRAVVQVPTTGSMSPTNTLSAVPLTMATDAYGNPVAAKGYLTSMVAVTPGVTYSTGVVMGAPTTFSGLTGTIQNVSAHMVGDQGLAPFMLLLFNHNAMGATDNSLFTMSTETGYYFLGAITLNPVDTGGGVSGQTMFQAANVGINVSDRGQGLTVVALPQANAAFTFSNASDLSITINTTA